MVGGGGKHWGEVSRGSWRSTDSTQAVSTGRGRYDSSEVGHKDVGQIRSVSAQQRWHARPSRALMQPGPPIPVRALAF